MRKQLFVFLLVMSFFGRLSAQRSSIGFQSDDDSYLGQGSDKYYTAGTFLYFRRALDAGGGSLENKIIGFEIAQKLYTPQSGSINYSGTDDPRFIDRPFAAYLYAASTLNFLYHNESNLKVGIQFGVVGPGALGRQTQDAVHTLFGMYRPSGWEYQIANSAVLNMSAEYNRLLARRRWLDVSVASYANIGNALTGAGFGPMLRIGVFNQLFHSESTQSALGTLQKTKSFHDHELFFYEKPQLNFIAYDATIEASLIRRSSSSSIEVTRSPEPVVLSNQLGLAYSNNRLTIDGAVIYRGKDVKTMMSPHQWGSLSAAYAFR